MTDQRQPKRTDTYMSMRFEVSIVLVLYCSSVADRPVEPGEPDIIYLKVGRTNNLLKRLQSWEQQCKSNTQVFRYYWPGTGTVKKDLIDFQRGSFKPGPPGPNTHLLERYHTAVSTLLHLLIPP
jgi:hypothetical protein